MISQRLTDFWPAIVQTVVFLILFVAIVWGVIMLVKMVRERQW